MSEMPQHDVRRARVGSQGVVVVSLLACVLFIGIFCSSLTATFLTETDATRLTKLNDKLVFFVTKRYENPQNIWVMWNSWELWTSDGTPEGTALVKPVYTGWNQPMISSPTFGRGYLFFAANGVEDKADAQSWKNGGGIWRTDASTSGTVRIETLAEKMLDANDTLFFTQHRFGSCTLYRSDGSDPGTTLIWQINEDCAFPLTGRGGELFFASASEKKDRIDCTLWASDGTASNIKSILRFQVKPGSTCIRDMVMLGDRLAILLTERGTTNSSLWTSDGTTPGTVPVLTIPGGFIENLNFRILHVVGDHLFFSSTRSGEEDACALWVSDGTPNGTRFLKSVCLDDFRMMTVGEQLFFIVDVPGRGWELWKSDGTVAGTQLVQSGFTYGRDGSYPTLLRADRGILYFNVDDNEGCALWRSDGTATGTAPLHRGCPQEIVSVNGTLFFVLSRNETAIELWKSDGTAAGTILIKVIP